MEPRGADDRLGHQTASPFHAPAHEDYGRSIFTERFWYAGAATPAGSPVFGAGLGYYPGRGVMDCYASATVDGVQTAFHGSTNQIDPTLTPSVGPFRIEIPEPGVRHRVILDKNNAGLEFDLEFRSDWGFHDEGRETRHRDGRLFADVSRYIQNGTFAGTVLVEGKEYTLTHDASFGARDRSWGLRIEADSDASSNKVSRFPKIFFAFFCAHFEDRSIHFFFKENEDGSYRFFSGDVLYRNASGGQDRQKIERIAHDIEWSDDPYSQFMSRGTLTLELEGGRMQALSFSALPGKLFLKAGLYGGLRGWFQGDDKGPLHMQTSRWEFDNPEHRAECRTLGEQILEVKADGVSGYATMQAGVAPGFPRYEEVQDRPVM